VHYGTEGHYSWIEGYLEWVEGKEARCEYYASLEKKLVSLKGLATGTSSLLANAYYSLSVGEKPSEKPRERANRLSIRRLIAT
jgi:hypothetical protein